MIWDLKKVDAWIKRFNQFYKNFVFWFYFYIHFPGDGNTGGKHYLDPSFFDDFYSSRLILKAAAAKLIKEKQNSHK